MILFIIAVVFITGSLGFALWYRMDKDSKEE
jgi:Trk-type K+ transport system membrane component